MKTANFDLMTNETAKIEVDRSVSGDAPIPNILGTVTISYPTNRFESHHADRGTIRGKARLLSRETSEGTRDDAAHGGRDGWAGAEAVCRNTLKDRPAALRDETGRKG